MTAPPDPARSHRPLVVEFVGLPGSGKSSVSHALAADFRARGVTAREPTYRLVHRSGALRRVSGKLGAIARTLVRKPRPAMAAVALTRGSRQPGLADQLSTCANLLFVSGLEYRVGGRPSACVLDQGPVQGIGSVWWRGRQRDEEAGRAWLAGVVPDDVTWWIVRVDVSTATARTRIGERSVAQGRIEANASDEARDRDWRRAGAALDAAWTLAEWLTRERPGQVQCARVSGEAPAGPEQTARGLADRILGTDRS